VLSNLISLHLFVPEIALVVGIVLLLVWDMAFALKRGAAAFIALSALLCAAVVTIVSGGASMDLFNGLIVRDALSDFFKLFFHVATAVIVIASLRARDVIDYTDGRDREAAEFFALLLTINLGMNLMAAASDLLLAYLALEMVSLMSYIIVGFRHRSATSAEASLKYVIYGGVASGVMLFGLSLLYGLSGATEFATVRAALIGAGPAVLPVLVLAVVCVLAGLGFKVAAVPFHMWCPDVYEGAPTPVTALLSVGPKAAGFALILRFFAGGAGAVPDDSQLFGVPWVVLLGTIAAATMTLGNLAAILQSNVKRLLAYSSIAHAGYLLMALCVFSRQAEHAVLLYLVAYLFMNLGAFIVVIGFSEAGVGETIESYRGLGSRAPLTAAALAVFLFSLTGLPPLAGFIGKFYLFAAVLQKGGNFYLALAIIGILNSAVSLYYYARILKEMYFNHAEEQAPLAVPGIHRGLAVALAVPTIVMGIYWSPIASYLSRALAN
jgi:NADH-quinone oxidoreductase subunit N